MEEGDKGLIRKIFWTHTITNLEEVNILKKNMIESCQKLECQGYGLLEDSLNPGKIDESYSVVSPDGKIFTPKQIEDYWMERKAAFNSQNIEDVKMYRLNLYYTGFMQK